MKWHFYLILFFLIFNQRTLFGEPVNISEKTRLCLDCHATYTPGIVEDWKKSLHSQTTPKEALKKAELERRVSNPDIPGDLTEIVVGCYECHGLNTRKHKDSFDHFYTQINVIVTPSDCRTCHSIEVDQYSMGMKAFAVENLEKNPVYSLLVETIISRKEYKNQKIANTPATESTKKETCFACHGTTVVVKGMKNITAGEMDLTVPDLAGFPNQGVGRVNPDGSKGSCTSCHTRHGFTLKEARKPYTCGQCHLDPDVPAYPVYKESKHGNIFYSRGDQWDFEAVPWVVGKNFSAPTCSGCHNSLIINTDGNVVANRSHDFGARIWIRIFGLIYSHPHPAHGATHGIRNAAGLPLPTTFDNIPASSYLLTTEQSSLRMASMTNVCKMCHSSSWVGSHFDKFQNTLGETNRMVLTSTELLQRAWKLKLAEPDNPFNETIEGLWIRQWLFYANSIRYASAMTGAQDYATFKNGWWELSQNIQTMDDWIRMNEKID
jgi:hypothetical protein